jgi:hypothetical protein
MTEKFLTLGGFAGKIEDPVILEAIRLAKVNVQKLKDDRDRFRYVVDLTEVAVTVEDPLERYVLTRTRIEKMHADHIVFYLNGAYRAFKKGVLK